MNMQFVKVLTDARTEGGAFYEGETRKVTDEVAGNLLGNGWAEKTEVSLPLSDAKQETPEPVTLEVDSVAIGTHAGEAG